MEFENYNRLPAKSRAAIRRMVELRGEDPSMEAWEREARKFRIRCGYFVFDYPSTIKKCTDRSEYIKQALTDIPKFPAL